MKTTNTTTQYEWFIKQYKKSGYKSLNQFAIATGLQKSSLSRYFSGQREMPTSMVITVAKHLKVSPITMLKAMGYQI